MKRAADGRRQRTKNIIVKREKVQSQERILAEHLFKDSCRASLQSILAVARVVQEPGLDLLNPSEMDNGRNSLIESRPSRDENGLGR